MNGYWMAAKIYYYLLTSTVDTWSHSEKKNGFVAFISFREMTFNSLCGRMFIVW